MSTLLKNWRSIARSNSSNAVLQTSNRIPAQANGAVYFALFSQRHYSGFVPVNRWTPDPRSGAKSVGKMAQCGSIRREAEDALIDYDEVERLASEHKPKIIVAGGSAYPRQIDFKRFRELRTRLTRCCWLIWRISLAWSRATFIRPVSSCPIATTTTHKHCGPRGGMILTNDEAIAGVNSAIFPGTQGGPLMHVIAAKAAAFGEALRPEFKEYSAAVIKNAQTQRPHLDGGLDVVSGGTDTHLTRRSTPEGQATRSRRRASKRRG